MGSAQSIRSTQFTRPVTPQPSDQEDHHISISNKMVERLVEDAALAGGAAPPAETFSKPRGDLKDKIFTEKIKCLDDTHSERSKITVDDLNSLIRRIDMRASNMVSVEPVCSDLHERIIDCYKEGEEAGDVVQCWSTIGEFSTCVQDAARARLHARTRKEAAELARRERHVAHAREYALRDLGNPP